MPCSAPARKGHRDIYRKRADGAGAVEELLVSEINKSVDSISPDGKYLLYNTSFLGEQSKVSLRVPLTGDRKPVLLAGGVYRANHGQFSPNSRWVAYMSQNRGGLRYLCRPRRGPG